MTVRLIFVAHAATRATARAAFAGDEPIDAGLWPPSLGRVELALAGPELRCVQTGQLFGLEAMADSGLRDCDFGHWTGRTLDEVSAADPDGVGEWLSSPSSAPHGGESLEQVLARVGSWLDDTAFPAGRVAVFTHPAVIRAAVVHALQASARSFWRIDVEPLSQTALTGQSGRWTLKELTRRRRENTVDPA